MNYPMKNGQIDPEFLDRVHESTNLRWNMTKSEVEAVLIYAQEVMQEISIKVGDKVQHVRSAKKGEVTYITKSGLGAKCKWEGKEEAGSPTKVSNLKKL
jgi:hypothetical protein